MANGACPENDPKATSLICEPFSTKSAVQRLDETKANYVKCEARCSESADRPAGERPASDRAPGERPAGDKPSDKPVSEPNNRIKSSAESGQADRSRVPLNNNNANLKDLNRLAQEAPAKFTSKEDCLLNSLLNSEHNRPLTSIILSNNLNKKFNSNQSNQFLIRPQSAGKRRPANAAKSTPNEINLETQLRLLICIDHNIDSSFAGEQEVPTFSSNSSEGPSSGCSRPSSICSSPIWPAAKPLHKTVSLLGDSPHHPAAPPGRLAQPKKANKSILSASLLTVNSKLPSLASLSKTSKAILSSKFTAKVCSKVNSKVLNHKSKSSSLASCIRAASPDAQSARPSDEAGRPAPPPNQVARRIAVRNESTGMRHTTANAGHIGRPTGSPTSITLSNHKSGNQTADVCRPTEQPVLAARNQTEQRAGNQQLPNLSASPDRKAATPKQADDPTVSITEFMSENQLKNGAEPSDDVSAQADAKKSDPSRCTPETDALRNDRNAPAKGAPSAAAGRSAGDSAVQADTALRDEARRRTSEDHELASSAAGAPSTAANPKCGSHNNRAIYDNESTGNQYTYQYRGQAIGEASDNAVINGSSDNGSNGLNGTNGANGARTANDAGRPGQLASGRTEPSHPKDPSYAKELNELGESRELSKALQTVSRSKSDVGHRLARAADRFKQSDLERVFNTIGLDVARTAGRPSDGPAYQSGARNPFLHHGIAFENDFERRFGTRPHFGSSFSNLYANRKLYPAVYTTPCGAACPSQRELSNGLLHYYSSGSQLYGNLSTVDSSYYTIDSSPKLGAEGNRTDRLDKCERFDRAEPEGRPDNRASETSARIDKSSKNEKQSAVYFKANQTESAATAGQTNQLINLTKSFNSMQLNEFKTAGMQSNGPSLLISASLPLDSGNLHSAANLATNLIANLDPSLATSFNSVGLPSRPPTLANGLQAGALPAAKISQQLIKPNSFKANLGLANGSSARPILADHHDLDGGEISIIERNARVIKWLYNCKKFYEFYESAA